MPDHTEDLLPGIKAKVVKIRVGKLRQHAALNPDHYKSKIFLTAVEKFDDEMFVNVEQLDLDAIEKNQDTIYVEEIITVDGGTAIERTKQLVPFTTAPAPVAEPAPKPKAKP
jgi:hypothetical protein